MQVIPPSINTLNTNATVQATQSNMTGEQQSNNANVMLAKQQLVVGGTVTVPSALTSVYSKLHKYAFEGKKTKLKKLLKDNKGNFLTSFLLYLLKIFKKIIKIN